MLNLNLNLEQSLMGNCKVDGHTKTLIVLRLVMFKSRQKMHGVHSNIELNLKKLA